MALLNLEVQGLDFGLTGKGTTNLRLLIQDLHLQEIMLLFQILKRLTPSRSYPRGIIRQERE